MISLARTLLLVATALIASACGDDSIRWRQKLTVEIDTPQGRKLGSAVTEVAVTIERSPGGPYSPEFKVTGEAVVIDLGSDKYVFALLSDSTPNETAKMAEAAFGIDHWIGRTTNTSDEARDYFMGIQGFRGSRELDQFYWPTLVTFTRMSDPGSFAVVNPSKTFGALGSGYRLVSMTVEMTDEPPKQGRVKTLLPWFAAAPPNLLEDAEVAKKLPGISKASFVRE